MAKYASSRGHNASSHSHQDGASTLPDVSVSESAPKDDEFRDGPSLSAVELFEHPIGDLLGEYDSDASAKKDSESTEASLAQSDAAKDTTKDAAEKIAKKEASQSVGATMPSLATRSHTVDAKTVSTVKKAGSRSTPVLVESRSGGARFGRSRRVRTQVGEEQARDRRRARKGAVFMAILFLGYMAWIVISGQADEFATSLATADYGWLCVGLLFMLARFGFGSLAYVFAVYIDPDSPVGVRDCMSVEANGTLFGNLTPMSSGSVPAQIYRLTKAGLDVGEATATQFTRFIFYQAGEVIVAALLLWLKFDFFLKNYGNFVILNLVVFVIQTLQALGLLVVCLLPRFVTRVGNWGIRFAQRHGWIKKEAAQRYLHVVNVQVTEFSRTFKQSFTHKTSLFLTWLVTLGMLVCFYSVPWVVLRAFGGDADFIECLAAGSMVQMIGNSVPLPGGAGGNEAGFAFFFGPVFGASAAAGFVVWRIITFFIPTAVCLPLSALRSNSSRSIYQRWNAYRTNRGRRATYSYRQNSKRRL